MEAVAETHIRALNWALKVQLKSGRNENMSKRVEIMMGTPTEIVYLSLLEQANYSQIGKEQA